MVSEGNSNRLTLVIPNSEPPLKIPLALPTGRRITSEGEAGRFFSTNLSAMAKELGNDLDLLQQSLSQAVNMATILFPGLNLADERSTLLSALAEHLVLDPSAPVVPGRPGQYQKLSEQGPNRDERVLTIQAIRQIKYPEWLSLPFPSGDMPEIPSDLFTAEQPLRLQEALGWEIPILASLKKDSLAGTTFKKDWYTDLELEHFRNQKSPPHIDTAYTLNDLKSRNPLPRIDSPIALLSNAWGILLENLFVARYLKSIDNGKATSEGAWLKARADRWALSLIRDAESISSGVRALGFGTARIHLAIPSDDDGILNAMAELAGEASAFVYLQNGIIHTPPLFEATGTEQVFVNLLLEKNAEKLSIADLEIQKRLTNTIN
jgi:hypothetical protein